MEAANRGLMHGVRSEHEKRRQQKLKKNMDGGAQKQIMIHLCDMHTMSGLDDAIMKKKCIIK